MIQQPLTLSGVAADKAKMPSDTFQMFEAGLVVLRIAVNRKRQYACLRCDRLDYLWLQIPAVRQEISLPAQSTDLNCKSQLVNRPSALLYLFEVRFCQREIFAKGVCIDPVWQPLGPFHRVGKAFKRGGW